MSEHISSDSQSQAWNIQIKTYQPQYQTQIIALILKIQQKEFDLPITLEDQRDLLDIANFYQRGNGNFWIAIDGGRAIGTIAAIDIGNNRLALRKMFVEAKYRGKTIGVGKQLLESLLRWARTKNVCALYLGTVDRFKAAHRFYEKNGFVLIDKLELPLNFPIMLGDNMFYCLNLHRL